jgi:probable rRNA maturation factor
LWLVTDAEEIQQLNASYRNIDRVTDVLTFPAWEGDAILCPPDGYLGDIAICYERAAEQAQEYGHSLERELAFLAVHGALHLLGYDHMKPEDEPSCFQQMKS